MVLIAFIKCSKLTKKRRPICLYVKQQQAKNLKRLHLYHPAWQAYSSEAQGQSVPRGKLGINVYNARKRGLYLWEHPE